MVWVLWDAVSVFRQLTIKLMKDTCAFVLEHIPRVSSLRSFFFLLTARISLDFSFCGFFLCQISFSSLLFSTPPALDIFNSPPPCLYLPILIFIHTLHPHVRSRFCASLSASSSLTAETKCTKHRCSENIIIMLLWCCWTWKRSVSCEKK